MPAFKQLNIEWLEEHFVVEDRDMDILSDPQQYILDKGGVILMTLDNDKPMGCVALMPKADGKYELTKMAVTKSYQGMGIGKLLMKAIIHRANKMGLNKIILVSNTKLTPALTLYKSFGFVEVENTVKEYDRCDIQMELSL